MSKRRWNCLRRSQKRSETKSDRQARRASVRNGLAEVMGTTRALEACPVLRTADLMPKLFPEERAACQREPMRAAGHEYVVISMTNPGYGDIAAELAETPNMALYWPTADGRRWIVVRPEFDADGSLWLSDIKHLSKGPVYGIIPMATDDEAEHSGQN